MPYMDYRELGVWQKAMSLTDEIYKLVKKLPKEENYALSDQMRRAAVSVPANIAEGRGRMSEKDFKKFLLISNGSLMELETHLLICVRQNYLSNADIEKALALTNEIRRMLTSLIIRLQNTIAASR